MHTRRCRFHATRWLTATAAIALALTVVGMVGPGEMLYGIFLLTAVTIQVGAMVVVELCARPILAGGVNILVALAVSAAVARRCTLPFAGFVTLLMLLVLLGSGCIAAVRLLMAS